MKKNRYWDSHPTWQKAEVMWEKGKEEAKEKEPIRSLKKLPNMIGISKETAKHLKWKSFKYMLSFDHNRKILKHFLRRPLLYTKRYVQSLFMKKSFSRNGDFFLYGVNDVEEFEALVEDQNNLLVIGFSYCHKPFECPSGRFSEDCIHDPDNTTCRQCFIGKCMNSLPTENVIPLCIPTVHYIGDKIFEAVHTDPDKKVIFLITACELTLEMFGDWGNMVGVQGIGVRLDGRICNTMRAFELSERGTKPGLTVVLDDSQKKMVEIIKKRRKTSTLSSYRNH